MKDATLCCLTPVEFAKNAVARGMGIQPRADSEAKVKKNLTTEHRRPTCSPHPSQSRPHFFCGAGAAMFIFGLSGGGLDDTQPNDHVESATRASKAKETKPARKNPCANLRTFLSFSSSTPDAITAPAVNTVLATLRINARHLHIARSIKI